MSYMGFTTNGLYCTLHFQKSAFKKEEKAQANKFEMHDYYNPEGQHRNYERNLRSLPRAAGLTQEAFPVRKCLKHSIQFLMSTQFMRLGNEKGQEILPTK